MWNHQSRIFSRLFIGFGCGLGLAALPLYLAETAPSRLKDKVGKYVFVEVGVLKANEVCDQGF